MTYQQTIDYLYEQLPMFSKVGHAAYKEDLHNTLSLCSFLGDPHTKFRSVHIAGTNGKGSTSHMLAAVLQQAGYKTGLYTSPHLKDFRERIRINGKMVSEKFVIDFVQKTKNISDEISPSFFELTVAMAFDWFATEKVDIAIVETGLGGRLDSTNVIKPILSVITNIGYDHVHILGNTLELIAKEKAGIIKQGIPVVIGEYTDTTKSIFIQKAAECNSPIFFASDTYHITDVRLSMSDIQFEVEDVIHKVREHFVLDLNGLYQIKNICTVLSAESIIMQNGYSIKNEDEKKALANVKKLTGLCGRWDVVEKDPTLILDVAHNEDGIKQILKQIAVLGCNLSDVHFVMGMVKDKDVTKVLSLLPPASNYYFTNAHIPRAMPAENMKAEAAKFDLNGSSFDDVNTAIRSAKSQAKKGDTIIVCGSVFLIAEVDC